MSTKTKKTKETSAIQRISESMDAGIKSGIPKEAAIITTMAIEIQILENRIAALEAKIQKS